ncbi:hypothetical protein CAPTEDRAFT_218747 [Capitella teleta]|uniref:GCS light chain n=1 Tax=Capitella teleta TaxID=283909 RepID=R7U7R2_CAPTE|nr:hypothetical protein CAPTEDRAFT_218747 [Capitella teleta]|eukprot:ELT99711.1 hypothetical protein CAPTEDRAFT_218747 [Capitella teleta]
MADEQPSIAPKASSLLCHTGNIVSWNRLKKQMRQTSTEELTDCIKGTLTAWLSDADRTELQYVSSIECLNTKFMEPLSSFPEARGELKVTVKLFLNSLEESAVRDALLKTTEDLGTDYIETVILALPERFRNFEDIQKVYQVLEDYVHKEKIFTLGLADLDKDLLEQTFEGLKTKPKTNQVNLAHCCVVPPELQEYAKENNIQLITHNDAKEILTRETLQELLKGVLTNRDASNWEVDWVVRYSVVIKQRGIIKTKGYIAKATRDLKKKD